MAMSKTVALIIESFNGYGRGLCKGIVKYADGNSSWSLLWSSLYLRKPSDESLVKILRQQRVDGILLRAPQSLADRIKAARIPVIDLFNVDQRGVAYLCDDRAVAEMAIKYFAENGFYHFAFCGFPGVHFSIARQTALADVLRRRGEPPPHVYMANSIRRRPMGILPHTEAGYYETESLIRWLSTLPMPICILACNDARALQILRACKVGGFNVPDDIAVLGIDNDELVTEVARPKLSSIQPNTEATAFEACESLDHLMRREKVTAGTRYIAPEKIIERDSTNTVATRDSVVQLACRLIRQHACDGFSVKECVNKLGVSRTQLEVKFKKVLGRTVHDEITRMRLRRVCQLLHTTDKTLSSIVAEIGYLDVSYMSNWFKKLMGISPGEYRHRARALGNAAGCDRVI
jgi:LacI family transcriptional regulator